MLSSKMRIDRRLSMSDAPAAIHPRRRLLRSGTGLNPPQTPPACLRKTRLSMHQQHNYDDDSDHGSISCELQALEKMMYEGFGLSDSIDFENGVPLAAAAAAASRSPLFVRGRFYEEYSARRNERLKSKKGMTAMDEKKTRYDLGVRTELPKRRDSKKLEVLKKKTTIPTPPMKEEMRLENVKPKSVVYSLRSIPKENKRLSLPLPLSLSTTSVGVERKRTTATAARGSRKF
ncbi:uncharacterized protein LOC124932635 [Impatiens glandulifera]|uniref:uncharacterized protein LOC124932635 n=1 Tax=Impatiens glandulifera TaxID=253017 RepID=UPI001FB18727|nr:uncharacterized protein LOC124932635 [Impatiens glandulifera]